MDKKEIQINNWLESPINNISVNKDFCLLYAVDLIDIIESSAYTIKNKNEFRDDIIELIYNYSNEQSRLQK
jgi:hypothetical protein